MTKIMPNDRYHVAYELITLPCILFMFNKTKFINCHSCGMFAMKSINIFIDLVNYDEIMIQ